MTTVEDRFRVTQLESDSTVKRQLYLEGKLENFRDEAAWMEAEFRTAQAQAKSDLDEAISEEQELRAIHETRGKALLESE